VFLFIAMGLVFGDEGVIPVFDHMLRSLVVEDVPHFRPFLSVLSDELDDFSILLLSPVSLDLTFIQVILPSLTTVFR
jgi:hypothetical protein